MGEVGEAGSITRDAAASLLGRVEALRLFRRRRLSMDTRLLLLTLCQDLLSIKAGGERYHQHATKMQVLLVVDFRQRLQTRTAPLVEYFREARKLHTISGVGNSSTRRCFATFREVSSLSSTPKRQRSQIMALVLIQPSTNIWKAALEPKLPCCVLAMKIIAKTFSTSRSFMVPTGPSPSLSSVPSRILSKYLF